MNINKMLSSNNEEILQLNRIKVLLTKFRKLKGTRKFEKNNENIEGKLLEKRRRKLTP